MQLSLEIHVHIRVISDYLVQFTNKNCLICSMQQCFHLRGKDPRVIKWLVETQMVMCTLYAGIKSLLIVLIHRGFKSLHHIKSQHLSVNSQKTLNTYLITSYSTCREMFLESQLICIWLYVIKSVLMGHLEVNVKNYLHCNQQLQILQNTVNVFTRETLNI